MKQKDINPKQISRLIQWRFDGRPTLMAVALNVSESAVCRWSSGSRHPRGTAAMLIRQWISELNAEVKR